MSKSKKVRNVTVCQNGKFARMERLAIGNNNKTSETFKQETEKSK